MDLRLKDRVVLVTGGSSGVGRATVETLLAEGARVATCARGADRLRAVADELRRDHGDRLFARSCDVLDAGAVAAFVDEARAELGPISGLVANAGRSLMRGFEATTDADWHAELELKLWGVLHPLRRVLGDLRAEEGASVVVVNAILAHQPETHLAATGAARAALLNLAKNLSTELAPDDVRVNSVCLGLVDTGQWRRRYEADDSNLSWDEWAARLAADRRIPMGRLGGAQEVADVVTMLLSTRTSYVTGSAIDVGGGVARHV